MQKITAISRTIVAFFLALVIAFTLLPGIANADQPGGLSGSITNTVNSPLAGAVVSISGPVTRNATSDAEGHFAISSIPFGVYHVSVSKSGYATVTDDHLAVTGPDTSLTVVLEAAPNQGVRQIGKIIVSAKNEAYNINVTPASRTIVLASVLQDQGQFQLARVLNEIPGVTTSLPFGYFLGGKGPFLNGFGQSLNVNIRGGLAYQTATMIDGHPIFSTDAFSTTGFNLGQLNLLGLKELDVFKGPGALSPTINSAINGSINYLTVDPGGPRTANVTVGTDGFGGTLNHISLNGSLPNSKIGYAFGYAAANTPGPFDGVQNYMSVFNGDHYFINGQLYQITPCAPGPGCTNFAPPGTPVYGPGQPEQPANPYLGTTLLACCVNQYSVYNSYTSFAKLRYSFSPTTSLSVMSLGTHDRTSPGMALGGGYNTLFDPGAGYAGTRMPGRYFELSTYGAPTQSLNNQLANEIELRTGIGRGLLRFSYLGLYQFTAFNENTTPFHGNNTYPVTLWGQLNLTPVDPTTGAPTGPPTTQLVNGLNATQLEPFGYQTISAFSKYRGMTAEYDLPIGNSLYTLALDRTVVVPDGGYFAWFNQVGGFTFQLNYPAIYEGNSKETVDSALLRAGFRPARNLDAIVSFYMNRYKNRASSVAAFFSNPTPQQLASFQDHINYYDAPRLALTYRPTPDLSYRFSAGGSITPLPLNALNASSSPPSFNGAGAYTEVLAATDLKPETATSYDLGMDYRFPSQTWILSADTWLTNLRGMFFTTQVPLGNFNDGAHGVHPLIGTKPANLSVARYYGGEATVRSTRTEGFNVAASLALMRAYTYNLPPNFYANLATGQPYAFNVAIVPYKNFYGGYFVGGAGNGTEAVPYSNGNLSLSYTFKNRSSLGLNTTYYGPNNSLYKPAFAVVSASARLPMAASTTLQLNLDNIGNIYPSSYQDIFDQSGVPIALADGTVGLAPTSGIGPRLFSVSIIKHFGSRNQ